MTRHLIFGQRRHGYFYPFDLVRPTFLLRDGAWSIADRWIMALSPVSVAAVVPEPLAAVTAAETGWGAPPSHVDDRDDVWLIVGATNPSGSGVNIADSHNTQFHFSDSCGDVFRIPGAEWNKRGADLLDWIRATNGDSCAVPTTVSAGADSFITAKGIWRLIERLDARLRADCELWRHAHGATSQPETHATTAVINRSDLWVGRGVRIGPQTVIEATSGPIILDDGVTVEPFTHLAGPAYIGKHTSLLGGKFSGGTAIGPGCKIAGEWEQSIAQGFSNKAHAGFFGHGILGEWVNLGAMTTNSDLKNNYGSVRVAQRGEMVDTGQMKIGSFIGDHTKTGIGTLIPTGATIGIGSNIFNGGLCPRDVPSFVWCGPEGNLEHRLDKMLATANAAVARRAQVLRAIGRSEALTPASIELLRRIFAETAPARRGFVSPPRI